MWRRRDGVSLTRWLDDPEPARGVRILENGGWKLYSYPDLARETNDLAYQMIEAGVGPHERVALVSSDPVRFLEGFFAALCCAATPVPMAPPSLLGDGYADYVAALLRGADVSAVVTEPDFVDQISKIMDVAGVGVPVLAGAPAPAARAVRDGDPDLAVVQFTSGSTARPRGIRIPRGALEAQLDMIYRWQEWNSDTSVLCWLPFHHDFGLIGCLLSSIVHQTDLWLMSPAQFILRPLDYLRCLGENSITHTALPPFSFSYLARRVRPEQLTGTDFSRWASAVIGAERIDPRGLASFAKLVQPHGFRWETFCPAYGLAEATLGVSGLPMGQVPKVVDIAWEDLRPERPVTVRGIQPLDAFDEAWGAAMVSCGTPLHTTDITIVDGAGRPLPDGCLGEIVARSASVGGGYEGDSSADSATRFDGGSLMTGDNGFLLDGELYVLGRMTDCINVHGRRVYVEQVEDQISAILGISGSRCVVVPQHSELGEGMAAVVEAADGAGFGEAISMLSAVAGRDMALAVYRCDRGTIPRTTSGKKRRRRLAQELMAGAVEGELVHRSAPWARP